MADDKTPHIETEAERLKLEAEAAKNLAEAEWLTSAAAKARSDAEVELIKGNAEAAKFLSDANKASAETRLVEANLVKLNFDAEREVEKRELELSADKYHRTYVYSESVSDSSVKKCVDQLNHWRRTATADDDKKIELLINSPGGSVIAGMALFDFIQEMRRDGWHFTTIARGYAASMGGILLQAGNVRICGPEAYILIHEIQAGAIGTMGEMEDEITFLKKIQARIIDIFVSRSKGKISKARFVNNWRRKNWWLTSDEALKLGIVDKIR